MRLSRVQISNYRSIKELDVNLKNCTLFVGKNNSGKSNILNAINLVLGERQPRVTIEDFYDKDASDDKKIKIVLTFTDFSKDQLGTICSEIRTKRKVDDVWYEPREYHEALHTFNEVRIELEASIENSNKIYYFGSLPYTYVTNELRDSIVTCVHIPSSRDYAQMLRTYEYTFFGKLLNQLYKSSDQAQKEVLERKLIEAQEACKTLFQDSERKLDEISKGIITHEGITLSFLPSDPKLFYKKIEILLNDGVNTDLDYKGAGIQSVIVISLFKMYSELKAGNSLLIVEEPELFLHPQANRHMANVLRGFCDKEKAQILITTHSPQYLIGRDISEIVLVKKIGKETKVKQLESIPNADKIRKEMTASNLELFFADKVVLVEGATDKIILPYFARSINRKYDFNKNNISIVEVGSVTNLPSYIELLNAYNIPCLSMVDKDFNSKWVVMPLSNRFGYGVDLGKDKPEDIKSKLNAHGVYPLSFGEIENYYTLDWLANVLDDLIGETSFPKELKIAISTAVKEFTDVTKQKEVEDKVRAMLKGSKSDDFPVIFSAIDVKAKLLAFNIDDPDKVSKKLESVFASFDMSKRIIALRMREHINVAEMPAEKGKEITEICAKIFEQ